MKIRKNGLSYFILQALAKASDSGVLESLSYSAQMRYFINLPYLKQDFKKSALSEAILRVKRNGLIEYERNTDGKIVLRLTSLGREYLGHKEKWDEKYRIVIWDIPERKRRLRDLFRRKLKDWEFVSLQKSVWVSKRNVTKKLKDLVKELEMEKWIVVIESDDESLGLINFHDRRGL